MSRDSSLLLHVTLVCLLYTESAAYFVRIVNIYHGVYLDEQTFLPATSPSFWVVDNSVIYTSDKTKSLCLSSSNVVEPCSGSVSPTEWSYDAGKMGLYTVSGSGKLYLTLDETSVGTSTTQQQGDNKARILLAPPAGDYDKPLVNKLKEALEKLKVDLADYSAVVALKEKIVQRNADLATQTKTAEEEYTSEVGKVERDHVRYHNLVGETVTTIGVQIATINGTQQTLTNDILPSIYDEISALHTKPSVFLEKLKREDLQQLLERSIAEVNKTLDGYLFRHRIAPVSTYDYLVILTSVLYVVYFVDIVGRVAGWNCFVSKRRRRLELEMEEPSNIQPEYYLEEDASTANFEFARTRESIKGKLQLGKTPTIKL